MALALCVVAGGPLGCSIRRPPLIALTGVTVAESTAEATALRFHLELVNPNPEPLRLREFRYTLLIDGTPVYRGRRAAEATLSAGGTRQLAIPAVLASTAIGTAAGGQPVELRYTLIGSLEYLSPGELAEILFDTGVRRTRVSFQESGSIRLSAP